MYAPLWQRGECTDRGALSTRERTTDLELGNPRSTLGWCLRRGFVAFAVAALVFVVLASTSVRNNADAAAKHAVRRPIHAEVSLSSEQGHKKKHCHNAVRGEKCFTGILWAKSHGIWDHPEWYLGLNVTSGFSEFQKLLHRTGRDNCSHPCGGDRVGFTPRVRNIPEFDVLLMPPGHPGNSSNATESAWNTTFAQDDAAGDWMNKTDVQVNVTNESSIHCRNAEDGDSCYRGVMWVMQHGLTEHSDWYPGLSTSSSFQDVQKHLHESQKGNCTAPCKPLSWKQMAAEFRSSDIANLTNPANSEDAVCNRLAAQPLANISGPRFRLPVDEEERCLKQFGALTNRVDKRGLGRNWCWVGLKNFGCYRHFYGHFNWKESQEFALKYMVTARAPFHPLRNPDVCDQRHLGMSPNWDHTQWAIARQWFDLNVAVYVLSLPSSIQRMQSMSERLMELEIPFTFVAGIDLRETDAMQQAIEDRIIPESFNVSRAQAEAIRSRNGMGAEGSILGTVGCAAGHFRAQAHAAKFSEGKRLAIVFEDDVSPGADFIPRLWSLVTEELPCDWQAVSLSSRCPYGDCVSPHLSRVRPDVNEPAWRCRHGVNYGFQGVLYRTSEIHSLQRVWKPVVFNDTRPHCLDIDVALASISDQVGFYAVPNVQVPGFLTETAEVSSRIGMNSATA